MVSTLKFVNRRWKLEANPHHIGEFLSLTNSTSWVCLVHIDQYPVVQLWLIILKMDWIKKGNAGMQQFHKSLKSQQAIKYPSFRDSRRSLPSLHCQKRCYIITQTNYHYNGADKRWTIVEQTNFTKIMVKSADFVNSYNGVDKLLHCTLLWTK